MFEGEEIVYSRKKCVELREDNSRIGIQGVEGEGRGVMEGEVV
ncbi:hypothetical protein COLO4_28360 [Corchorus olitorius]|uniref:Uncharacterized protein n=1 Tax=Corchorus olitorius TaxID=93759 RepID=A0A1R3HLM0_9ROSI|nr:hypothetical protein COLO4_28360 [Corchorus olitorius]